MSKQLVLAMALAIAALLGFGAVVGTSMASMAGTSKTEAIEAPDAVEYERPDASLQSLSALTAAKGSVYLLDIASLKPKEALQIADLTIEQMLSLLSTPGDDLQGFTSPIPDQTEILLYGIDDEQTLHLMLRLKEPEILSGLGEAVMLDALTLSLTSFAEIEQLRFMIDAQAGYQGRMDLTQVFGRQNLCLSYEGE